MSGTAVAVMATLGLAWLNQSSVHTSRTVLLMPSMDIEGQAFVTSVYKGNDGVKRTSTAGCIGYGDRVCACINRVGVAEISDGGP